MSKRVPISLRVHASEGIKAGTFLKVDGKTVGRIVEEVPPGGGLAGAFAKCEIDVDVVDKLGDNSGYGMPKVSFLITRT